MKFSSIIAAGLAAVVTAAPAKVEERSSFDFANQFNNLQSFGNLDLNYFLAVNSLNLDLFGQLAQNQNLNILNFQSLFSDNAVFDIQNLLLLQQILDLQNFANAGLFSGFDLSGLNLGGFNFGLLDSNIGSLGLNQFIDSSFVPQIQQIVSQQVTTVVAKE